MSGTEIIIITAIVASTAVGVRAQRQAAGAQQVELDIASRQEAAGARDREVKRRRRLVAILGAQAADAAARGLSMEGSVANISIEDAKRASEDSLIDDVNTRARINSLVRRRNTVGRLANLRSATTILGAAERVAGTGVFDKET